MSMIGLFTTTARLATSGSGGDAAAAEGFGTALQEALSAAPGAAPSPGQTPSSAAAPLPGVVSAPDLVDGGTRVVSASTSPATAALPTPEVPAVTELVEGDARATGASTGSAAAGVATVILASPELHPLAEPVEGADPGGVPGVIASPGPATVTVPNAGTTPLSGATAGHEPAEGADPGGVPGVVASAGTATAAALLPGSAPAPEEAPLVEPVEGDARATVASAGSATAGVATAAAATVILATPEVPQLAEPVEGDARAAVASAGPATVTVPTSGANPPTGPVEGDALVAATSTGPAPVASVNVPQAPVAPVVAAAVAVADPVGGSSSGGRVEESTAADGSGRPVSAAHSAPRGHLPETARAVTPAATAPVEPPAAPVGGASPVAQASAVMPTSAATAPSASAPLSAQLARPIFSLAAAGDGAHVMTVSVTPDELGPVTVRAHVGAEGVRVELFAPNDQGREAIRAILPDLRRDLAGSGLGGNLNLSSQNQPPAQNAGQAGAGQAGAGQPNADGADHGGATRGEAETGDRGTAEPRPQAGPGQTSGTTSTIDVMA